MKLHQASTGRQIGETLIVHYITNEDAAFELSSRRGYYLRVRDTAVVGKK